MIVALSLRPKKSEWAVYWYLCGSDLESKHGAASADLEEMFQIQPPKGVKVVVQTGGAKGWKREEIPSDRIGRFIYDKKGWKKKETLELQSMGDPGTLVDFLRFCDKNYPAEKTMLILWNHGGGTLGGVSYDENYGMDSLSLAELRDAFAQTGKSYDIIGFDACLMANLETANSVSPYGTYLIASQELEPANGWNYTGIIEALQHDPEIMPEDLGRAVCDSFMQGCIRNRSDREATLSLIDLSKIPELSEQYQQYGKELFAHALKEETFLASYARKVEQVERYGGNSREEGYTDMVDLGGVLKCQQISDRSPSEEFQVEPKQLLEQSVIYQTRGPYRDQGSGLSCYYPLDGALSSLYQFRTISRMESYKNLYQYQITGVLNSAALEYLQENEMDVQEGAALITVEHLGLEDYPVQTTSNGELVLELGKRADYLKKVEGYLTWCGKDGEQMIGLGNEPVGTSDWDNGRFTTGFCDHWWYLNGHLVYSFSRENRADGSVLSVPVLINGEQRFIRVAGKKDGTGEVLGIRGRMNNEYMAERQDGFLKADDQITTLLYQDHGQEMVWTEYETFPATEELTVEYRPLPDGIYVWAYDMTDLQNHDAVSDIVCYEIREGEIYE